MRKRIIWIMILGGIFLTVMAISNYVSGKVLQVGNFDRKLPIYCVETPEKVVALTFDAAWGNEDTEILLDLLNQYDVKATFFMTGQWVDHFPEDVRSFYEQGHDIANHSDKHPHIDALSQEELAADIKSCNEKIQEITGAIPLLYRGPYGEYNNTLIELLQKDNQFCIQWDVDSLDWKDPSPSQIAENVLSKVKNGSIILLHNGAKNTPEALPVILQGLKDEGYEFVLVKDLIYLQDYTIDHTGMQKQAS